MITKPLFALLFAVIPTVLYSQTISDGWGIVQPQGQVVWQTHPQSTTYEGAIVVQQPCADCYQTSQGLVYEQGETLMAFEHEPMETVYSASVVTNSDYTIELAALTEIVRRQEHQIISLKTDVADIKNLLEKIYQGQANPDDAKTLKARE